MEKKLKHYGGQGYSYSKENGIFRVTTKNEFKVFTKLTEAIKYFNSLNEEKTMWDFTNIPELLNSYTY